jgi:hypothetical protein
LTGTAPVPYRAAMIGIASKALRRRRRFAATADRV